MCHAPCDKQSRGLIPDFISNSNRTPSNILVILISLFKMSSKVNSRAGKDEDCSNEHLLRDIEEISKALYLPPKAFNSSFVHQSNVATSTDNLESRSQSVIHSLSHKDKLFKSLLHKDKKPSLWKWKPLKALTHSRGHQIDCWFYLHVHAIEGLAYNFNNINLCVTWKRKGDVRETRPALVRVGTADFEETLMHKCTIHASRTGTQNIAKYEPKLFSICISVIGAQAVDIGKYWIDLTRLLPLTLDELGGAKWSTGKWTTSFKLAGMAEGAMLNATFGFSLLGDKSSNPGYFMKVPNAVTEDGVRRADNFSPFDSNKASRLHSYGSLSTLSTQESHNLSQSKGTELIDKIISNSNLELGKSINLLYQKLDEGNVRNLIEFDLVCESLESVKQNSGVSPVPDDGSSRHDCRAAEFDTGQGIEASAEDQVSTEQQDSQRFDSSLIEIIDAAQIFEEDDALDVNMVQNSKLDVNTQLQNVSVTDDTESECERRSVEELGVEELDSVFYDMLTSGAMESDALVDLDKICNQEYFPKSVSLVDIADSIESEFLEMLNIEQNSSNVVDIEPSKYCLLGQFKEENKTLENHIVDADSIEEQESFYLAPKRLQCSDDLDFSFNFQAVGRNNHVQPTRSVGTGTTAKMLEYLETESLMQECGLDEKAFWNSAHVNSGGFGSPVYLSDEKPLKLPSLGEGMGPLIQTRDGGFLQSMSPLFFQNAVNGARLVVHISAPIVLPAEMGFTTMEMLQRWASVGVEKIANHAKEFMPLEDITGKTMQQVMSEAQYGSCVRTRQELQHASDIALELVGETQTAQNNPLSMGSSDGFLSCTSFEDGESEYVSLENLVPLALSNIEGLLIQGLKIQSGMQDKESPSSIRVQFPANTGLRSLDVDDLIKCSVSLEEWMRLDSGDFDATDEIDDHFWRVFAAHCAESIDLDGGQSVRKNDPAKFLGRQHGVCHNNFTMALKVQLRDPLRNNEIVGLFMLALVRVERIYSSLIPGSPCILPVNTANAEQEDLKEKIQQQTGSGGKLICGEDIPQFKVLDVLLAGLNEPLSDKQMWGSTRQQQSGARWLSSSGIAQTNRHHISNSNATTIPAMTTMRKAWQDNFLWSISPPTQGEAAPWDDQVALNVHIRNPDIIIVLNEPSLYQQK